MTRWWPPIGLAAMLLLGWAVRDGSTSIDAWFQHLGREMGQNRKLFLIFTYPPLLAFVLVVAVAVVLRRRQWWLAAAMVVSPPLTLAVVEVCKRAFGRYKGSGLAYPSGHTAFLVVVMGLVVVVAGAAIWAVVVAVSVSMLGMFGQAITYHYFTDAVGAALLGTAIVSVLCAICEQKLRKTYDPGVATDLR